METKNVVGSGACAFLDADAKNWEETSMDVSRPCVQLSNNQKRVITSAMVKKAHGYSFASTSWSDGTSFDFPFMFLRDNCQCSACFDHSSGQRKVMIDTIGDDVEGKTTISPDGLSLEWKDGHRSVFSADWLSKRLPNDAAKHDDLRKTEWEAWSAEDMKTRLPRHEYSQVMEETRGLQNLIKDLWVHGLAVIHNAPARQGVVEKIANRVSLIGMLKTNYGTTFDVQTKLDPSNLAYTPVELPLHSDLVQYDRKPQIQMLHCIAQSTTGGDNTFVDGLYVTEKLKEAYPEEYELLCTEDIFLSDAGSDEAGRYDIRNETPLIETDKQGRFKSLNFNNHIRGSLMLQNPERYCRVYSAVRTLYTLMKQDEFVFNIRLESGDVVIFNNIRLLHGRRAYQLPEQGAEVSARHLQGCYLDWDNVFSAYRTASQQGSSPELAAIEGLSLGADADGSAGSSQLDSDSGSEDSGAAEMCQ